MGCISGTLQRRWAIVGEAAEFAFKVGPMRMLLSTDSVNRQWRGGFIFMELSKLGRGWPKLS